MYFNDKIGVEGKKQVLIIFLIYLFFTLTHKCHLHQRDLNPSKHKTSYRLLEGGVEREKNVTFIPLLFSWKTH